MVERATVVHEWMEIYIGRKFKVSQIAVHDQFGICREELYYIGFFSIHNITSPVTTFTITTNQVNLIIEFTRIY